MQSASTYYYFPATQPYSIIMLPQPLQHAWCINLREKLESNFQIFMHHILASVGNSTKCATSVSVRGPCFAGSTAATIYRSCRRNTFYEGLLVPWIDCSLEDKLKFLLNILCPHGKAGEVWACMAARYLGLHWALAMQGRTANYIVYCRIYWSIIITLSW